MVIADTEVIAAAPVRFLVAGMGDAMATFYEARACQNNPDACNLIAPLTYRPPRIAMAIAGACLEVLFCQGVQAKDDCEQGRLSAAVDEVSSCFSAGMGSAVAVFYGERACQNNPHACSQRHAAR
jgi:glycerol dehydrogenase